MSAGSCTNIKREVKDEDKNGGKANNGSKDSKDSHEQKKDKKKENRNICKEKCECTLLQKYCYRKSLENVQKHLREKKGDIDVNEKGCHGRTALMKAIQVGRGIEEEVVNLEEKMTTIVKTLLAQNANLNERDEDGNTVLHHIAEGTRLVRKMNILMEPARLILQHGGNVNLENNEGFTPSQVAFNNNSEKMGYLLL